MPKVICLMDECQYCEDDTCTAEEITLLADHCCDGGCDDGWLIEKGEEDDDWKWMQ